jgi:hypothetical protein
MLHAHKDRVTRSRAEAKRTLCGLIPMTLFVSWSFLRCASSNPHLHRGGTRMPEMSICTVASTSKTLTSRKDASQFFLVYSTF